MSLPSEIWENIFDFNDDEDNLGMRSLDRNNQNAKILVKNRVSLDDAEKSSDKFFFSKIHIDDRTDDFTFEIIKSSWIKLKDISISSCILNNLDLSIFPNLENVNIENSFIKNLKVKNSNISIISSSINKNNYTKQNFVNCKIDVSVNSLLNFGQKIKGCVNKLSLDDVLLSDDIFDAGIDFDDYELDCLEELSLIQDSDNSIYACNFPASLKKIKFSTELDISNTNIEEIYVFIETMNELDYIYEMQMPITLNKITVAYRKHGSKINFNNLVGDLRNFFPNLLIDIRQL
jgi:hypothetical protein